MIEDLKREENLEFQHRCWKVERAAWIVMTLVLAVALLGLMGGSGLLSQEVKYARSGLIGAEISRYTRLGNTTRLHVDIKQDSGKARLWIHKDIFDAYQIAQITPQPEGSYATPDRLWFVFPVTEPKAPLLITFHLRSERAGAVQTRLGTAGSEPLELSQFIYP